ncbi:hypothetical protein OHT93_09245 [Streptomyces sp. NBC_00191]|uniref:hypothetical protein n=1 Tax=Streptomyces sp. NBC_00191 TaxID=2975674 RepID=UPI00325566C6
MTQDSWNPSEFDLALGTMVREAALVDLVLVMVAKELCGRPYGARLISGESTSRVLTVCRSLADVHHSIDEQMRVEFKALLTEAKRAFEARHRYVHGTALPNGAGKIYAYRTRRLTIAVECTQVDVDELSKLTEEFRALGLALSDWGARLLNPAITEGSDVEEFGPFDDEDFGTLET